MKVTFTKQQNLLSLSDIRRQASVADGYSIPFTGGGKLYKDTNGNRFVAVYNTASLTIDLVSLTTWAIVDSSSADVRCYTSINDDDVELIVKE